MVSIILEWNNETEDKARRAGFIEKTVLIKDDAVQSTEENKRKLEREVKALRPYQFLVADFW